MYTPSFLYGLSTVVLFAMADASRAENPHNGTWEVEAKGPRGGVSGIELIVDGGGGTYWNRSSMMAATSSDPCSKEKYQLEDVESTTDRLVFTLRRSKRLTGCSDLRFDLRLEGSALTGPVYLLSSSGEQRTPVVVTATRR